MAPVAELALDWVHIKTVLIFLTLYFEMIIEMILQQDVAKMI